MFSPVRTVKHDILGRVDVYEFKRWPDTDGCGAQTDFYRNGADVNNPKQYGIKLFGTSVEAFAAYQRQKLAARKRLAPPVGRMVQWKIGRWSRWGYQTCIADCSECSVKRAQLDCNPNARDIFFKWLGEVATKMQKKDPTGKATLDAFFAAGSWKYIDDLQTKVFDKEISSETAVKKLKANPLFECRAGCLSDVGIGDFRPKYNISMYGADHPNSKLYRGLRSIDLTGTQYDNLFDIDGDGGSSFVDRNPRLHLGGKFRPRDAATIGGDLHTGNIGLWKDNPVCIDFGFHCVKSREVGYTDEDAGIED